MKERLAEEKELVQELNKIKNKGKQRWSEEKHNNWETKDNFADWFVGKYAKHGGKCYYCGLEGNVLSNYRQQLKGIDMYITEKMKRGNEKGSGFRKGTRGKSLEVDKKKPKQPYNEGNCVLACYPCNNAKSDVFTDKEFTIIGAVIGALKGEGKTKRINSMKKNNYIKGLLKGVKNLKESKASKLKTALKKPKKNK